jgi:hypothetical protein
MTKNRFRDRTEKYVVMCGSCQLIRYFDDRKLAESYCHKHASLYVNGRIAHVAVVEPNLPRNWGRP